MAGGRQLRFWLIGLVVFVAALWVLREVLLPFVAGMAIAYFLDPVADRLQKWGLSRLMATVVVTAGIVAVLVAALLLLVPLLQAQVMSFLVRLPGYIDMLREAAEPIIQMGVERLPPDQVETLRTQASGFIGNALAFVGTVLKGLLSGGFALLNLLSLVFITPVVAFYQLRDWDRMVTKVDNWLPREHADTIRAQFREIDQTLAGFIRGQASVCLVLGAFYAIGLSVVGLDLGLLVGLGAGIISFVPYLGTISGFVVGIGLALAQFDTYTPVALVAGVFVAGQMIEGNFLTPKLVGDRIGLHPVWVIFALLAGGALFGFVGILLAVPVAAVVGVLARFFLGQYLNSPYFQGRGGARRDLPPPPPAAPDAT
ncbi:AI-2E family transporter [Caenispirillum salinarum]|uniref:AI-2E family transporter n=1 Tax=Caenispirillum salinarum TaxID=859058 RepID=UPI00384AC693